MSLSLQGKDSIGMIDNRTFHPFCSAQNQVLLSPKASHYYFSIKFLISQHKLQEPCPILENHRHYLALRNDRNNYLER